MLSSFSHRFVLVTSLCFLAGCATPAPPLPPEKGQSVTQKIVWTPLSRVTEPESGLHWARHQVGEGRLFGITWSGSQFVAVGKWSIQASSDGLAWKSGEVSGQSNLSAITWDGAQFVVVGGVLLDKKYVPFVMTSPDGTIWTERSAPDSGKFLKSVAWSGKRFVAVGSGDILISADGVTWSVASKQVDGQLMTGVTWAVTQFVAVGHDHRLSSLILTSPDGITWTPRSASGRELKGIAWSKARLVAVGHGTILTSSDGTAWSEQKISADLDLNGVTWGKSQFVAVGRTQDPSARLHTIPVILISPDGVTWSRESTPGDGSLLAITHNGARFVAVGQMRSRRYYDAIILTSP